MTQRQRLSLSRHDDDDFTSVEDGCNTYGQCHSRNLSIQTFAVRTRRHRRDITHSIDVVAKKAGIGENGIICECFDASSRFERRARFVESNVPVFANTTEEQFNASVGFDGLFISGAVGQQIVRIAVENVNVFRANVD